MGDDVLTRFNTILRSPAKYALGVEFKYNGLYLDGNNKWCLDFGGGFLSPFGTSTRNNLKFDDKEKIVDVWEKLF
jgi:hypothetical protein